MKIGRYFFDPPRLISVITLLIFAGTTTELYFLGHYEEFWQTVPIILIAISFLIYLSIEVGKNQRLLKVMQLLMFLCVVSGFMGIWLHLQANLEFEKEMYPTKSGLNLIGDSLSGALPTLAPGTMVVLGLIGNLYVIVKSNNQK